MYTDPKEQDPDADFDSTPLEKPAGECDLEDGTCESCQ